MCISRGEGGRPREGGEREGGGEGLHGSTWEEVVCLVEITIGWQGWQMQLGFSFGSSQSETRVVRKLRIRIDAGGGFSNSNRTGDRRHNTDDGSAS